VDHALVASVASGMFMNAGHLLENIIFMALRRCWPEIYYYRTRSGKEVDFIVPERGHVRVLVQVCESLRNPQTREREISALTEAMRELECQNGIIVTAEEEERLDSVGGTIRIIPAWRFLLELPDSNTTH